MAVAACLLIAACSSDADGGDAASTGDGALTGASTAEAVTAEQASPEETTPVAADDPAPVGSAASTPPSSSADVSASNTADADGAEPGPPTTAGPNNDAASSATAPPSTSTSTSPSPSDSVATSAPAPIGDASNPIAVPVGLLDDGMATSGAARCIFADLRSVPVPPNPGYVGESVGGQTISGDELWAVSFYLMLYANCERQARGVAPFTMYDASKQRAMQQTVLGITESHQGFGERADIAGGVTAEGHGGGPRPTEAIEHDGPEDTDGNGWWSVDEVGRRAVSGNRSSGGTGLVDHGDAMTDPEFRCIFAAATLGAEADHRVDVIIFYGNRC
ncbi:MAG: hypothetical protein AAGD35_13815 [Actinomycetota bacterium]